MNCPICNSEHVREKNVANLAELKGETHEVFAPAFVCEKCKYVWMSDKQMNLLRVKTADKYKEEHGLLTSEQLRALRERFGMTQPEFALYLNVGPASIKRWETYGVQDVAMNDHIRLKCDEQQADLNSLQIQMHRPSDIYSGKRPFNYEKTTNLILMLVEHADSPIFTNKALFYADFRHFKKHGQGITGSTYARLEFGPCPDRYKIIYNKLVDEKKLAEGEGHKLVKIVDPDLSCFTQDELETINEIIELCKKDNGRNLYNLSHEEKGYLETSWFRNISYEHAKTLKI